MRERVRVGAAAVAVAAALAAAGCSSGTTGAALPVASSAPSGSAAPSSDAPSSSASRPARPAPRPRDGGIPGAGPGAASSGCALVTAAEVSAAFGVGGVKAKDSPRQEGVGRNSYACNYSGRGLVVVLQLVVLNSKLGPGEAQERVKRSLAGAGSTHTDSVPGLGDAASTFTFTKGGTSFDGIAATANTEDGALGIVGVTVHRPNAARALVKLTRSAFAKAT